MLYGSPSFLDVEQTYLDKYKGVENFYNIGLESSGGDNLTNNPNREDIISRIKNTLHKKYDEMSVDERKEILVRMVKKIQILAINGQMI